MPKLGGNPWYNAGVGSLSGAAYIGRRLAKSAAGMASKMRGLQALKKSIAASKIQTAFRRRKQRKSNPMRRRVVKSQQGGVGSFSKFLLAKRPSSRVRAMKKVSTANYFIQNAGQKILANEGFQGLHSFSYSSQGTLEAILSKVPNTIDAPQNGGSQVRKYLLEQVTGEYLITNSTTSTAYVDIYDIVRKRDEGAPEKNGFRPTASPTNAWAQGVLDENGGSTPDVELTINSLPTDSQLFKDYFKVVKRSHIAMQQGATHRHMVKLHPNQLVDSSLLDRSTGDLAGLTVYTMIVCYGQPISSSDPESGASATTTSMISLDIVHAARYKYTWVADQSVNFYYDNQLVSLVQENIINVGSGQPDTVKIV